MSHIECLSYYSVKLATTVNKEFSGSTILNSKLSLCIFNLYVQNNLSFI